MKLKLIISILLIYHFSTAQSLDELVRDAVQNNLELKILETQYRAALEIGPQVSQRPDPEVGIGLFPLPVETRLGAQILRVGATQMFPWPGLLDSKKGLEFAKAKAIYERIGAKALDLSYQVEQAYYKLYEIQESRAIIQQNFAILEALEKIALAKVESGKTTTADVLRVQLKLEELKQELKILKNAETKPISTLNQLLNHPTGNSIQINDSLQFAIIPFTKDTLIAHIEINHPMVRLFELQQEVSKQAIVVNELNGKPSFGVGMDYILVNPRDDAEPAHNGRDIIQLRGSVKIPLFKQKYEAKEREENLKIAALEDQKLDAVSKFSAAIEKAYSDYETAQLRMELYEKQIEITQAAINILETEYSTKGNYFDELLRLEKELIDYDLKILKAIVLSHLAKSSIERFIIQ